MNRTLHQQLVELRGRAKAWLEGEPDERFNPYCGLCSNIALGASYLGYLRDLMARWPGGSGSRAFPVPHPTEPPSLACLSATPDQRWNPEYEYARNRWALLDWLIAQTKPAKEAA